MDNPSKLSIKTLNCKNVKRSLNCVRSLCRTADIVLLQETWLYPHDLCYLENIDHEFSYTAKSSWTRQLVFVKEEPTGDLQYCGVKVH